jgi:hypothetical protein
MLPLLADLISQVSRRSRAHPLRSVVSVHNTALRPSGRTDDHVPIRSLPSRPRPALRHTAAAGQPVRAGMRRAWPCRRLERTLRAALQSPRLGVSRPVRSAVSRDSGSIGSMANPDMSQTGRAVPGMNEPLGRYTVTVTVGCDGGSLPDPGVFAVAAGQAAWSRPRASSARTWRTGSSAWSRSQRQTGTLPWPSPGPPSPAHSSARALSSGRSADGRAHHRAEVRTIP